MFQNIYKTNPDTISNILAECLQERVTALRQQKLAVYIDGTCSNNGKADMKCGSGVWIKPNHA